MLRLLAARTAAHRRLLLAVLALVTVGVTLPGVAALLLGPVQRHGLDLALSRADPADVDVVGHLGDVPSEGAAAVVADTRAVLADRLRPLPVTSRLFAVSAPRVLTATSRRAGAPAVETPAKQPAVAYLGAVEGADDAVRVLAGRSPRPGATPAETMLPLAAATVLGIVPGGTVRLGPPADPGDAMRPLTLRVVGLYAPVPVRLWTDDPLHGTGTDPRHHASVTFDAVPEHGPFLLDPRDLTGPAAAGSVLERVQVIAHPDLTGTGLPADGAVVAAAGDAAAGAQAATVRAAVLAVVLLALGLAVAALALAGRLVAGVREAEGALLTAYGAGRGQLALVAGLEALGLAAAATLLAVPATAAVGHLLGRLPWAREAEATGTAAVTAGGVAAVVAATLLLAAVLVVLGVRAPGEPVAPTRAGLVARSGADLLVALLGTVGWWQLRAGGAAAGVLAGGDTGPDAVRAVAPVLCLGAVVLVVLRALPPLLALADRRARRARGLLLPLAGFELARRPRAVAASLLVVSGAAGAGLGVALLATWDGARHDRADVLAGADLRLALTGPVRPGDAGRLAAATGGTVSPGTRRPVIVGHWLGDAGHPPLLVAVDARTAGAVLRGRPPDGEGWRDVAARLLPPGAVAGLPLAAPVLTGRAGAGQGVQATLGLVLQDAAGVRVTRWAAPAPLDGRPRPLALDGDVPAGCTLVAVAARLTGTAEAPPKSLAEVVLDVRLPAGAGGGAGSGAAWQARATGTDPSRLVGAGARVVPAAGAATLHLTTSVRPGALEEMPAQLVATAFRPPAQVPVAVSPAMAEAAGVRPGESLTVTVGSAEVRTTVTEVVPAVPSAPDEPVLLADVDLLSRALIGAGELESAVDGWWVGGGTAAAVHGGDQVRGLGLGTPAPLAVTARDLAGGPLRVAYPLTLFALVPTCLLLLLAGAALAVTADLHGRRRDLLRLRAVGVRRRDLGRALLAQHGGLVAVQLLAGTAVGAVTARLLAAPLVGPVSGLATAAVLPRWPVPVEAALVAGQLLACGATLAVLVTLRVRALHGPRLAAGLRGESG